MSRCQHAVDLRWPQDALSSTNTRQQQRIIVIIKIIIIIVIIIVIIITPIIITIVVVIIIIIILLFLGAAQGISLCNSYLEWLDGVLAPPNLLLVLNVRSEIRMGA